MMVIGCLVGLDGWIVKVMSVMSHQGAEGKTLI